MAIKPPPPPWEVLGDIVGNKGLRDEVDRGVKTLAQGALNRLDVVSRDEFDAQTEILRRTRERVQALEAELAQLTSELEQLTREG